MALPTQSLADEPTRLFIADTFPLMPVVPSIHVTDPAFACPALVQLAVETTALLLPARAFTVYPTISLAVEPVSMESSVPSGL